MRKITIVLLLALLTSFVACSSSDGDESASTSTGGVDDTTTVDPAPTFDSPEADEIREIVREQMDELKLQGVIVKASVDGEVILTEAFGESMTNVPATTDMSFRNGAVAISYVSTLLLTLVDDGEVSLDDKVSTWLPDVPYADQITLGQLAHMTSGLYDYVQDEGFIDAVYADPFRQWTPEELVAIGTSHPLQYEPGTNWSYAHTNYVLLGLALEEATGESISELLEERVFDPLDIHDTVDPGSAVIPEPALHAFTSERREALSVPVGTPFYEESTYWSPSWTITHGAIQTTTIDDMHDSWTAIGSGELLSEESYALLIDPKLRETSTSLDGCPTCHEMNDFYTYGLGIVISGDWLMQNPLFAGFGGAAAYLPSEKVTIAVEATVAEDGFDPTTGTARNPADAIWRQIGALLAPDHVPPERPTG